MNTSPEALPSELVTELVNAAADGRALGLCSRRTYSAYLSSIDARYWRGTLKHPARVPPKLAPLLPWAAADYIAARNIGALKQVEIPASPDVIGEMTRCNDVNIFAFVADKLHLNFQDIQSDRIKGALCGGSPHIAEYLLSLQPDCNCDGVVLHENTIVYFVAKLGMAEFRRRFRPRRGWCDVSPIVMKLLPDCSIYDFRRKTTLKAPSTIYIDMTEIDVAMPEVVSGNELFDTAMAFARRRQRARAGV